MVSKIVDTMKILVFSYLITGVLLLILSFCLYKFGLANWQVTTGIIITYALSTFLGGYFLGKKEKSRKMIWGILFGIIYFLVLFLVSVIMNKGVSSDYASIIQCGAVCTAAGAVGGFINNL